MGLERWLSGRKRTTRNRLKGNLPWVRIPPSPLLNVFGLFPPPRGCKEIRALGPQSRRYQLRGGGALLLVVDQAGGKYCLGRVISLVLDYNVALGH